MFYFTTPNEDLGLCVTAW
ncbi:unnamed protein product, partial [Allacma fusca]